MHGEQGASLLLIQEQARSSRIMHVIDHLIINCCMLGGVVPVEHLFLLNYM